VRTPGLNCFTRRRFSLLRICAIAFLFISIPLTLQCTAVAAQQSAPPETRRDVQKAPPEFGQISGHVCRADDGTPIAMALVTANTVIEVDDTRVPVQQSARTDSDGAYTFAKLIPGKYTVLAEHHGFASREFNRAGNQPNEKLIPLSAGQSVDKIDIRLSISGTISGSVFDDENDPLEGQPVDAIRLTYHRGGQTEEVTVKTAQTDDLGNFRLYGLPPGDYFIRVLNLNNYFEHANAKVHDSGPAYRSSYYAGTPTLENAREVIVRAGSETTDIRFAIGKQSTYTIYGNIIDPSAGAFPKRYFIGPYHVGSGVLSVRDSPPNPDGSFAIRGVPPGDYMMWAFALLLGPATRAEQMQHSSSGILPIRVANGDVHTTLHIGLRGEVTGKVIIENSPGQSAAGIGVTLLAEWMFKIYNPFNNPNDVTTDQNGRFKIQNVEPTNYFFSLTGKPEIYLKRAVCNGTDYTFRPFTMNSGATFGECVLTLANDTGVIKGQVLNGDKPVPDQIVVAIPQTLSLRQFSPYTMVGITDANGEYQLTGIIPGDYFLFAVPPDDAETYFDIDFADRNQRDAERVSVKSNETKNIPLRPVTPQ
jgi:Carboxypeptidase regulatory-like domain